MRKCLELKLKGGVLSLYLIVFKFIIISVIPGRPLVESYMVCTRIDHKTDASRILKVDDTIPVDS